MSKGGEGVTVTAVSSEKECSCSARCEIMLTGSTPLSGVLTSLSGVLLSGSVLSGAFGSAISL